MYNYETNKWRRWGDLEKLELEDVYAIARKKHFDHMREWACFKKGVK